MPLTALTFPALSIWKILTFISNFIFDSIDSGGYTAVVYKGKRREERKGSEKGREKEQQQFNRAQRKKSVAQMRTARSMTTARRGCRT
jgi:hypothetical protein